MFLGRKFFIRVATLALVLSIVPAISSNANAATSYLNAGTYYAYETFSTSGSWTRPYGVTQIDYLVVAGGGRGGGSQLSTHFAGGGGGGGGVRSGNLNVSQTTYTITVGTGQAAGCSQGRGGNSSLAGTDIVTVSATGGGSGSCNTSTGDGSGGLDGYSGGSGGGAGAQVYSKTFGAGNAGSYTPVEGYSGGSSVLSTTDSSVQSGGGGGGASQAGTNGTSGTGGKGGNGITSSITGTSVVYGGGGGGGTRSGTGGGVAGTGGGGSGGVNGGQGTAGTDGLGGGGGGTSLYNGNRGGNGVVIVRYIISNPSAPSLPAVSDSGLSNSDGITNATTFSLTGTAVGGATVQIYDGTNAAGSPCTANMSTGVYSCSLSGLTQGTHTFTARASFGGGSAVTSSSSLTVVIDSTAPTLTPSASISIAENQTSIATIACGETCALAMTGGVDSLAVTFSTGTGTLIFNSAPDYEAPNDVGGNRTYAITIQGTDNAGNVTTVNYVVSITNANESSSISVPSLATTSYKGQTETITVSVNVAGKVRFFVGSKRISSCLAKSTSGTYPNYTATCYWMPPVTGRQNITAILTPSDNTFSSSTSSSAFVQVIQRRGTR